MRDTRDLSQGVPNPGYCTNRCLFSVPQLELKKRKVGASDREGHQGPPASPAHCFHEADGEGRGCLAVTGQGTPGEGSDPGSRLVRTTGLIERGKSFFWTWMENTWGDFVPHLSFPHGNGRFWAGEGDDGGAEPAWGQDASAGEVGAGGWGSGDESTGSWEGGCQEWCRGSQHSQVQWEGPGGRQGKEAKCKESKGSGGKESVAREADMKGGVRQGRDERAMARVLLPPPQAPGAL